MRGQDSRGTVDGDTAMSSAPYFVQECPTCGRSLQVRVEYLGKQVVCQHCGGQLHAMDPVLRRFVGDPESSGILQRADELIEAAAHRPRSIPR